MGSETKIAWCDMTFNPWRGCSKVSAGCEHCYAETLSKRNPAVLGEWGPSGTRAIAAESYWTLPLKWDRAAEKAGVRRRVFCASLADIFEDRPELQAPRARLVTVMKQTASLEWLILTKRPENAQRLMELAGWPVDLFHVMIGVSAENQEMADLRIPILLNTPVRRRFVSAEPLLGAVDFSKYLGFVRVDWIITGAESGRGAREMSTDWVRSIRDQCVEARVPFFYKQNAINGHKIERPFLDGSQWLQFP